MQKHAYRNMRTAQAQVSLRMRPDDTLRMHTML